MEKWKRIVQLVNEAEASCKTCKMVAKANEGTVLQKICTYHKNIRVAVVFGAPEMWTELETKAAEKYFGETDDK